MSSSDEIMPSLLLKKQRVAELLLKIQEKKSRIIEANQQLYQVQSNLKATRLKAKRVSQYQADIERLNIVLEEVQRSVESMSILQLNEITKYNNPPEVIKIALEGICFMLRAKKMNWVEIRKEINKGNFIREILRFNVASADPAIIKTIQEQYILANKWNLERLQKASKAMGPLGQWLQCQVELHDASQKSQAALDLMQTRQKATLLMDQQEMIQSKVDEEQAEADEMEEELEQLQSEVQQMEVLVSSGPQQPPQEKASVITKRVRFMAGGAETEADRASKLSVIRNSILKVKLPRTMQTDNYLFTQYKERAEDRFGITPFMGLQYNKGKFVKGPFSVVPGGGYRFEQKRKLFVDQGADRLSLVPVNEIGTERPSIYMVSDKGVERASFAGGVEQGTSRPSLIQAVEQGTSRQSLMSRINEQTASRQSLQSQKQGIDKSTSRQTLIAGQDQAVGSDGPAVLQVDASTGRPSLMTQDELSSKRITIISTTEKGIQRLSASEFIAKKPPADHQITENMQFSQPKGHPAIIQVAPPEEPSPKQSFSLQTEIQRQMAIGQNMNFQQNRIPVQMIEAGTRFSTAHPLFVEHGIDPIALEAQGIEVYVQTPQGLVRHNTIANAGFFIRQPEPASPRNPVVENATAFQRQSIMNQLRARAVSANVQTDHEFRAENVISATTQLNFQPKSEIPERNEVALNGETETEESEALPDDFAAVMVGTARRDTERYRRVSKAKGVHTAFAEYYLESTADKIIREMVKPRFLLRDYTKVTWSRGTQTDDMQVGYSGYLPGLISRPMSIADQQRQHGLSNEGFKYSIGREANELNQRSLNSPIRVAAGLLGQPVFRQGSNNEISRIDHVAGMSSTNSIINAFGSVERPRDPANLHGKIGLRFQNWDFGRDQHWRYVILDPTGVNQQLNQTQPVFASNSSEIRVSKSLPKTATYSQVYPPPHARVQGALNHTIDPHFNISQNGSFLTPNGTVLSTTGIVSPKDSLQPGTHQRQQFQAPNRFNMIGIQFVDKDKSKLTEHSFDDKNRLPGAPKTVVETVQAPYVSFAKNRETVDIKKILAANPHLKYEDVASGKYSVTYDFPQKDTNPTNRK